MKPQTIIAGIDEAGRGALAGPVVAGACILKAGKVPSFICDSKKLEASEREEAYAWVVEHCAYGYGIVDATNIDALGILGATEAAMQQAVAILAETEKPTYLLVDGRDKFWFDYPHSSVIRGDESEQCIAAASIIAKVTRDRMMVEYAQEFADYGFEQHKGYGTEEHGNCIRQFGPCLLHRKTFLKNFTIAEARVR